MIKVMMQHEPSNPWEVKASVRIPANHSRDVSTDYENMLKRSVWYLLLITEPAHKNSIFDQNMQKPKKILEVHIFSQTKNQYKNNSWDADVREFWPSEECDWISEVKIAPFLHAQHKPLLLFTSFSPAVS